MGKNSNRRSIIGHASMAMLGVLLLVSSLAALCVTLVRAQAVTTLNKFVQADVSSTSGAVSFFAIPANGGARYPLSVDAYQALSIKIEGKLYSNNPFVKRDFALNTTGTTAKFGDTIRTTWAYPNFDLVEDVYPVAIGSSGQIVVQLSVLNRRATSIQVDGTQFLLDLSRMGMNGSPHTLTRWGSAATWSQYSASGKAVPPFFAILEKSLTSAGTPYDPGKVGMGFTDRADLGLIRPTRMTIGDGATMSKIAFGPPTLPPGGYSSNAILLEWNGSETPSFGQMTLAKFSYGTGGYQQCQGSLYAMIIYPERLTLDTAQKQYAMNPFPVEALVFNTSATVAANNVAATLHVGDSLSIISPLPLSNNGKSQTQSPAGSSIARLGFVDLIWNVESPRPITDTSDFNSSLMLEVAAGGVAQPTLATCTMPAVLAHVIPKIDPPLHIRGGDTLPPVTLASFGSRLDSAFIVADDRSTDSGLSNITWEVRFAPPALFKVRTSPPLPFAECLHAPDTVYITQLDSTQGACIDFTFTDCVGNQSTKRVCMDTHSEHSGLALSPIEVATAIYPNPCRDEVTLRLGYTESEMPQVHVYSESGDEVGVALLSRQQAGTFRLDMHTLASGTYVVRISGRNWSRSVRVHHVR